MERVSTHQLPWHTSHQPRQRTFAQSTKLQDVLYEIRGPVHDHAARLEAEGHRILKLNIGNPAPFGFEAPDVIMRDMIQSLPYAQGYSDSKGIPSARRAVFTRYGAVDIPLGWPLRYAHSAAEVIDTRDVDALSKIVAVLAKNW